VKTITMQLLGCDIGRLKYLYFFKYWSLALLTHSLTISAVLSIHVNYFLFCHNKYLIVLNVTGISLKTRCIVASENSKASAKHTEHTFRNFVSVMNG